MPFAIGCCRSILGFVVVYLSRRSAEVYVCVRLFLLDSHLPRACCSHGCESCRASYLRSVPSAPSTPSMLNSCVLMGHHCRKEPAGTRCRNRAAGRTFSRPSQQRTCPSSPPHREPATRRRTASSQESSSWQQMPKKELTGK